MTPLPVGPASPSLTRRTAVGAAWLLLWRLATRLLGMVSTVVLVRLLAPADFGLVALATAFSQAVDWLSAMGVRDALVREDRLDRPLYDTAFTLSALRGGAMALAIAAIAWPVGQFFHDARLAAVLWVLAGSTLLAALENIGTVDFRRELTFRQEFRLAVIPRIAGIAAAIGTAIALRSYWALVAGILTNTTLRLLLSYLMHPYRPGLTLTAWRRISGFSFWTWVTAIVQMLRDRIDTVAIGRMFGAGPVGLYAVGAEIGSLTSTELVEPLTAALFPGFAAARRAGTDAADSFFRAVAATFLLTLPMGVGLALLAEPAVRLAFGPAWQAAVPLVQVFALIGTVKVVAYISGVLLNAHGLIHVQFRILLVSLVVRAAVLLTLLRPLGLMGAAAAAAACAAVEEALFLRATFRAFALRAIDLLRVTWRCVLAAAAMGSCLLWLGIASAPADASAGALALRLVVGVGSGAALYAAVLLALWWLSGRPAGAETTLLQLLADMRRRTA